MDYLSKNVKYLRTKNKLTQEQLANVVGKARTLVSQWESDDREMTTEDIIKLADYFNVTMDSFVGSDLSLNNTDDSIGDLGVLFNKKYDLDDTDKAIIASIVKKYEDKIDNELDK